MKIQKKIKDYDTVRTNMKELHQDNKKLRIKLKFERTGNVPEEHQRENKEMEKERDY